MRPQIEVLHTCCIHTVFLWLKREIRVEKLISVMMRGITAPQSHQLQCSDAAMGWVTKKCYPWSTIPFKDPIVSTTFNQPPTSFYFSNHHHQFCLSANKPSTTFHTSFDNVYQHHTSFYSLFFYDGDVYIYLQLTYVKTLSKSLMFMSAPQEISSSTSVGSIGSPQEMLNSSIGGALR